VTLDPVLQIFFDEAEELVRTFEDGVLGLQVALQDRELLHCIFRAAHTLKGNSSLLGFERIATVTHALEELLVRLRAGESAPSRDVVDTLLAASDLLRLLVSRVRAGDEGDVPGIDELMDHLAGHVQSMGHPVAAPAPCPSAPEVLYKITFAPPAGLLLRGLDPLRLLVALGELGEIERVKTEAGTLPPLAALDPEAASLGFTCWLRSRCARADIESSLDFVDEPGALRIVVVDGRSWSRASTPTSSASIGWRVPPSWATAGSRSSSTGRAGWP
jgi:two-component system chemotaxis sensor kinase CheA